MVNLLCGGDSRIWWGMYPKPYSFIDIAVLDEVRGRFAGGDALAILDPSLDRILWANGAGARLLGFADVESASGGAAELGVIARRQISSLAGFPRIARPAAVALRLSRGLSSRLVTLTVGSVELPGGEDAVLLCADASAPRESGELAASVLGGLVGEGQAAAILDGEARIAAATAGFDDLALAPATLAELVEDVRGEPDRLVKRKIPGGGGAYPAAIARLADDPALHLLIVIAEAVEDETKTSGDTSTEDTAPDPAPAATGGEPEPADVGTARSDMPAFDRNNPPARFVWRTDAEGRFTTISGEFAQAVGATAADIIGRSFRDVATVFGMDHDGEVAGLLERRDTWSGRTLWWPVAGTNLQAPVDLAALPVYGRERNFEGFRGFGVVRTADARPDPERIGLSLVPGAKVEPLTPDAASAALQPAASEEDPAAEDDPFRGEVPVLEITPQPERTAEGKIVRLSERRQASAEKHLSSVERQAFREIGERLRREQKTEEPPAGRPAEASDTSRQETGEPETEVAKLEEAGSSPVVIESSPDEASDEDMVQAREPVPTSQDERDLLALDVPASADDPTDEAADADDPVETDAVPAAKAPARTDTSILDQLPVPVLIHSGDELHYANPEFLRLTAYDSLDELEQAGGLGELFAEPYGEHADDDARHELRIRTRLGEQFPAEALLRSVPWAGRKALMLVVRQTGEAVSITGPTAEELRQRLSEMRTIIDTATDGVILVDMEGVIRSISQPAEALFGFESDEVKGKPLVSLFAVESQGMVNDYLDNLSLGGVASVLNDGREVIGRESEGRFIPMFMTMGRLPGEGGFCAVVRDITQWKRAEEELTKARTDAERASAQKSEFLARISHEIRTPLNAIIGFSELMVDEKFGPIPNDRYRDYLRDINRSGNHVLDLVNDLLDLSKIEAGQQEMSYEAVSLNDALAEAVAMMQPQANRERVIIRSSFAPRLPDIVADLRSIRQIALNILSNAVRYTQAGGQVVISTAYEKSGNIVMRVRDTGVGMTPAELEQAMKPFQQINALKRGRGDGTGLGLPLTKAMVEANRARFAISSKPGEGTLVEITFPSTRVLAQ